jgi:predicted phage tail protein
VDTATLNSSTFTLVKQGSTTPVAATVSYDAQAKKAILKPSSALAEGGTYTATLKGGTNGVKDTSGNPLQTDRTWSFTTTSVMAPSNLSATRVGSANKQRVDLSWVDNSKVEAKFVIERSTASNFATNLVTYEASANATSFSDTGIQSNKQYYYRVFAVNSSGTRSAASNVVSVTTAK